MQPIRRQSFSGASRSKAAAELSARSLRPRRMAFCKALIASQGEASIGRGIGACLAGRPHAEVRVEGVCKISGPFKFASLSLRRSEERKNK